VQSGWVRERERFRGSCLVIQSAGEGWYGWWGEGVRRWFTGVAARGEWEGARLSSEARAWSARRWCKVVREDSPAGEESGAKVRSLKKVNFPLTRFTEHFSGDLDVNLKPILTAIFASINPDQRSILLPKDFSGEREK